MFHSDAVDHPPSNQEPQPIREDETVDDVAVAAVVESQILIAAQKVLEDGLHQAQRRPIHVVDGGGQKQQAANHPAQVRSIGGQTQAGLPMISCGIILLNSHLGVNIGIRPAE